MLSTIHLRTNQILSPGGEGSEDFFFFGGGVSNGFQEERGGGEISRRQLSITVGLLTIDSQ